MGKNKKESFNFIKEKIWRKLQGWESKLLSQAGREVLVKAVIQAIPTFSMRCFKIPLGFCQETEAMIKKFWWGQRGDRRKIHWIKWDELTNPLSFVQRLTTCKAGVKALQNKNTLFYRVFKAKFFPNCLIMEAKHSRSRSHAWTSILYGRDVLKRGCRWRISDGKSVGIW